VLCLDRRLERVVTAVRHLALISAFAICLTVAVAVEFTQIFFAPRTVSINDLVAETLGILIPREVTGLINIGNFITTSVVVKSKPIGLLYADSGFKPLDKQQFDKLQSLSGRVATLFGKG